MRRQQNRLTIIVLGGILAGGLSWARTLASAEDQPQEQQLQLQQLQLQLQLQHQTGPAKSIVIIGDSHSCGPFGTSVLNSVSQRGRTADLFCAESSEARHWLLGLNPRGVRCKFKSTDEAVARDCFDTGQVPMVSKILGARKYDEIWIALGTNSLMSNTADEFHLKLIEDIEAAAGQQILPCKWIGPPNLRPDQSQGFPAGRIAKLQSNLGEFTNSLEKLLIKHCEFIDSRPFTSASVPGGETIDGVHRRAPSAQYWSDGVTSLCL